MFKIKTCRKEKEAEKIGEFLIGPNAFEHEWAPGEKDFAKKAPGQSLKGKNHRYWYVEVNGEVVAAIGVRENKYQSGGYEMDEDYFAVHKKFRRRKIGSLLFEEVERFVRERGGRYVHILSCDTDIYRPAREFYKKNGYHEAGRMPDYYVEGEGRVDFFKSMKQ